MRSVFADYPFLKQALVFTCLKYNSFETLWEKEKLLISSNFSSSHSVFYPLEQLSAIFLESKIFVCLLFHFGTVQNLLFRKGLIQQHKILSFNPHSDKTKLNNFCTMCSLIFDPHFLLNCCSIL